MGGLKNATFDEKLEYNLPKWVERFGLAADDIRAALKSDPHSVEDLRSLIGGEKLTPVNGEKLLACYRNLRYRKPKVGGRPDKAVAIPGQFNEAMNFAAHISRLTEEEHRLENRLAEIKAEKAKYGPVLGAMEALKRQVDKVKEDVHKE